MRGVKAASLSLEEQLAEVEARAAAIMCDCDHAFQSCDGCRGIRALQSRRRHLQRMIADRDAGRAVVDDRQAVAPPTCDPCPMCGFAMVLRRGTRGPFWGCSRFPACRSTRNADADGKPAGRVATAAERRARIAAHNAFGMIWRSNKVPMPEAYRWLTRAMNREQQMLIGEMGVEQCAEVVRLVSEKLPTLGNRKARRAAFDKTSRRAFMAAAKNERK